MFSMSRSTYPAILKKIWLPILKFKKKWWKKGNNSKMGNQIYWSFLPHVRFLILLTVFELLSKTCNFTICSIFSNSGHVGWCTASSDTILKLDTLVMIQTKFGFHWSSTSLYHKKMICFYTSLQKNGPFIVLINIYGLCKT
jgi:hypothetical protein